MGEIKYYSEAGLQKLKDELNYLKKACESVSDRQMPDELWAVVERIYNAAQD